jgi:hypothetical protein
MIELILRFLDGMNLVPLRMLNALRRPPPAHLPKTTFLSNGSIFRAASNDNRPPLPVDRRSL